MNSIRMSNILDPEQARRFVGPDLGPNCLPRLSADDTGRQRVKEQHTKAHREEQSNIIEVLFTVFQLRHLPLKLILIRTHFTYRANYKK